MNRKFSEQHLFEIQLLFNDFNLEMVLFFLLLLGPNPLPYLRGFKIYNYYFIIIINNNKIKNLSTFDR